MSKKYNFNLGFTFLRYDIRDKYKLTNKEYAVAHALTFVGQSNGTFATGSLEGHRTNYKPDVKQLVKDLGFSSKTIYRALEKLRSEKLMLIEPDCLEATEKFVVEEQNKNDKQFLFAIIQHGHREKLKLNFTEYLVCTTYSSLGEGRNWVTLDKNRIAKTIGIKVSWLHKIIKKMVSENLMITQKRQISGGKEFLDVQMTDLWNKKRSTQKKQLK